MNILVLNGSPRSNGNTAQMVAKFQKGAIENGHIVTVVSVCQKKIAGCLACEYCHKDNKRECIQKDDMKDIYLQLDKAEMILLASPIYYHSFLGQLQCALNRIYALDKPTNLKKAAMFLSSESGNVYEGALYEYQQSFIEYLELEDLGIYTSSDKEKNNEATLKEIDHFSKKI